MIADFVIKLMAGTTIMWCLMPRRDVTDGFFKIQMRVVLGLAVLAFLLLSAAPDPRIVVPVDSQHVSGGTAPTGEAEPTGGGSVLVESPSLRRLRPVWQGVLCLSIAIVCYAGSVAWALGRRSPGNVFVWIAGVLSVAALSVRSLSAGLTSGQARPIWDSLQLFADSASAVLLGSMVTAMLLGHWYLTSPTMSVRPLMWLNAAIVFAVMARAVASSVIPLVAPVELGETTLLLWLVLRWLGAIVAPVVVAVMVWRIMKYRNTQSATGVLFAGVILVFMGEMAAALLQRQAGVPL